jgi:hypothetical protein
LASQHFRGLFVLPFFVVTPLYVSLSTTDTLTVHQHHHHHHLLLQDLDLPRIGGSWHKGISNSALLQLWLGAGDEAQTQGTGLHCDICNNFIIQVNEWLLAFKRSKTGWLVEGLVG